jgi:hypothetical protein
MLEDAVFPREKDAIVDLTWAVDLTRAVDLARAKILVPERLPIDLNEAKFRCRVAQSLILQRQRPGHADALHIPGSDIILYGILPSVHKLWPGRNALGGFADYGNLWFPL